MDFDFFEHKGILHFFFSMSYALGQDFFSDLFFSILQRYLSKKSWKKSGVIERLKKKYLNFFSFFKNFSIFLSYSIETLLEKGKRTE